MDYCLPGGNPLSQKVSSMRPANNLLQKTLTFLLLATFAVPTQAQAQAPLPGNSAPVPGGSAPLPGASAPLPGNSSASAPLPGGSQLAAPGRAGAPAPIPGVATNPSSLATYRSLPISASGAAVRLEELRNLMPNIKAKDFQDLVDFYLEWVQDMADGHWKLSQAFAKVDTLKAAAEQEKQTTLKLGSLKRQAMLLKAEFLIRENRQAEALHPLVDIVTAEPRTQTGESAYGLLKQIGFSEEAALTTPHAPQTPQTPAATSPVPDKQG